jgi:hypothetical protein
MGEPCGGGTGFHFNRIKFAVVAALVAFTPFTQIALFQLDPGDSHDMVLFIPD